MNLAFAMAYAIIQGLMKFETVPVAWQPIVRYCLNVLGANEDGTPKDAPQPTA